MKRYRTYRFETNADLGDGKVVRVVVLVDKFGVKVRRKHSRTFFSVGLNVTARLVAIEDQKRRVAYLQSRPSKLMSVSER